MTISEQLSRRLPRRAKELYRSSLIQARVWQKGGRVLPSFLLIGAQKCATTSLTAALKSHPGIGSSIFKEVHFFDLNHDKGADWYASHFPKTGEHSLTFEATPYYLFHPQVPARVHAANSKMQLIVILRDPVARAHSHFQMERQQGTESTSDFAEAIEKENDRVSEDLDLMTSGAKNESKHVQRFSYLHRGYYEEQLRRWLKYFPREQLYAIDYAKYQREPGEVLADLSEFLGVANDFQLPSRGLMSAKYKPMGDALKEQLRTHFQEKNSRLEALLEMKFDWLR